MNNTELADWIGYGRNNEENRKRRLVRRWIREHREHAPIIDRVNFPDDRRIYPAIARRG